MSRIFRLPFRAIGRGAVALCCAAMLFSEPSEVWAKQPQVSDKHTDANQDGPQISLDLFSAHGMGQPQPNSQTYYYYPYPQHESDKGADAFLGVSSGLWVAGFTLALVLTTIIQAILILRAEYLTRAALKLSIRQGMRAKIEAKRQAKDMADSIAAAQASAKAAEKAANVSEQTLIATNRPWVQIKAEISGPLKFIEDEIVAEITVALTNVGKSPATFVTLNLTLHSDSAAASRYAREITQYPLGGKLLGYGNILFPNDPARPQQYAIRMKRSEFLRRIGEINDLPPEPDEKSSEHAPYTHACPGILACAFYILPGDPKQRPKYTTMIYQLRLNREFGETGFDGSIGEFAIGDLLLEPSFMSGEAT